MAHLNAKKLFPLFLALALCLTSVNALACTAVYVGSDLTADGTTMFARSEDISNSYNKLFYAIPAGVHTAGEVYNGCYGFTYTFTRTATPTRRSAMITARRRMASARTAVRPMRIRPMRQAERTAWA